MSTPKSRRKPPPRAPVPRPVIGRPPASVRIPRPPKAARRMTLPRPPARSAPRPKAAGRGLAGALGIFEPETSSTLLDLVDNLLNKGVVLHADVILALADVDLVYLRLTALLAAADRVFGPRDDARGT